MANANSKSPRRLQGEEATALRRIDRSTKLDDYKNGGILQYVLRQLAA